ncbi:MAG: sulfatase [Planctomycetota bacterium]
MDRAWRPLLRRASDYFGINAVRPTAAWSAIEDRYEKTRFSQDGRMMWIFAIPVSTNNSIRLFLEINMKSLTMDRRNFLKRSGLAAAGLVLVGYSGFASTNKPHKKPNIVHILIDDLGFSDVGCYGSDFCETPNIDRLASKGMKFTNGYSASPICSPARAAFLTGKSPARLNFEFVTKYENQSFDWNQQWYDRWADRELIPPPFTLNLPLEEVTVAESLKSAGYVTGITGKWHVAGHHKDYNGWSLTHGPRQQGFDWALETYGSHPRDYTKEEKGRFGSFENGQYPEDTLTTSAIQFMSDNKAKPFFLFVSHHYVHTPLGTKCKWLVDKYKAKAKALGRDYEDKRILYAAFVETLDHYVGQLVDAIDQLGLADNTLVFFTSDNGGHPVHAFNAPLRGSKWNLYEGGVRVPTIARWPRVIKPNTICDAPIIGMDFMPTYSEVADDENKNHKDIDGKSILPLLKGQQCRELKDRTLYWHFPYYHPERSYNNCPVEIGINDGYVSRTQPQSSIRFGDYKLIYFYENQKCELYNLAHDISEQNDLSSKMPDKTKNLKQNLFDYLEKVKARLPRKNEK